jgi:hypothetical protein
MKAAEGRGDADKADVGVSARDHGGHADAFDGGCGEGRAKKGAPTGPASHRRLSHQSQPEQCEEVVVLSGY